MTMVKPLNQQQKIKLSNQVEKELGELHPQEVELIWMIRNVYRFGTIQIETRDGLPNDLLRTVDRTRLGNFSRLSTT